jgi:hypothetical protein
MCLKVSFFHKNLQAFLLPNFKIQSRFSRVSLEFFLMVFSLLGHFFLFMLLFVKKNYYFKLLIKYLFKILDY